MTPTGGFKGGPGDVALSGSKIFPMLVLNFLPKHVSAPSPGKNPVSASDDTHLKSNTFAHFCGPRVFTRDISNIFPQLYIWSILYMPNSKKDAQEASGGRKKKKKKKN